MLEGIDFINEDDVEVTLPDESFHPLDDSKFTNDLGEPIPAPPSPSESSSSSSSKSLN